MNKTSFIQKKSYNILGKKIFEIITDYSELNIDGDPIFMVENKFPFQKNNLN